MKYLDVVVAGVLCLVVVQLSLVTGASTRHHHGRYHRRYYRQETLPQNAASPPSNVSGDATPSNCSHCSARQAKREYRLASIMNEILRKLHLRAPPNITRRQLPDIPPLRDLIGDDMVSDAPPNNGYSDDDYHATTMKIMLFPTSGMKNFWLSCCSPIYQDFGSFELCCL